jgi:SAM-dependent methyltransferase
VNESATVRGDYERLHEALDDENLDAIAGIAGCAPAIGRLNYVDDATLAALVDRMSIAEGCRVLDLGCGRGFLGRWLSAHGRRVAYTAMDYCRPALDSVRRSIPEADVVWGDVNSMTDGSYEAIFAIESIWAVDDALAVRLRAALVPGGRIAISISSLDASHDGRIDTTIASLRNARFDVENVAFAAGHSEVVGRLCAALMIEPPSDPWVRERMTAEAVLTLAALRDGAFRSDLLLAVART